MRTFSFVLIAVFWLAVVTYLVITTQGTADCSISYPC